MTSPSPTASCCASCGGSGTQSRPSRCSMATAVDHWTWGAVERPPKPPVTLGGAPAEPGHPSTEVGGVGAVERLSKPAVALGGAPAEPGRPSTSWRWPVAGSAGGLRPSTPGSEDMALTDLPEDAV